MLGSDVCTHIAQRSRLSIPYLIVTRNPPLIHLQRHHDARMCHRTLPKDEWMGTDNRIEAGTEWYDNYSGGGDTLCQNTD